MWADASKLLKTNAVPDHVAQVCKYDAEATFPRLCCNNI